MISIGSTQKKSFIAGTANLSVTGVDTELQRTAKSVRHHAAINRMPTQSLQSKRLGCIKKPTEKRSNKSPKYQKYFKLVALPRQTLVYN
jgi:hypothetical protein